MEESSFELGLVVDVVSMDLLYAGDGVSQVFRIEVGGCWCLVGVRAVLKMRRARRMRDCRSAKERGSRLRDNRSSECPAIVANERIGRGRRGEICRKEGEGDGGRSASEQKSGAGSVLVVGGDGCSARRKAVDRTCVWAGAE